MMLQASTPIPISVLCPLCGWEVLCGLQGYQSRNFYELKDRYLIINFANQKSLFSFNNYGWYLRMLHFTLFLQLCRFCPLLRIRRAALWSCHWDVQSLLWDLLLWDERFEASKEKQSINVSDRSWLLAKVLAKFQLNQSFTTGRLKAQRSST